MVVPPLNPFTNGMRNFSCRKYLKLRSFVKSMSIMNNFNAEEYRQPGEVDSHWELKKEFIEMYKYIFDKEKLLCLSQAYCDIVLKNSRYPDPVIKVISELSKPLKVCKQFQENNGSSSVKRNINEHQKESKVNCMYKHSERPFKQMKFLANKEQSNSTFLSTSTALQPSVENFKNIHPLPLCIKEDAQIFSKPDQILRTAIEHSEKSCKPMNFSDNEGQTSSTFLPTLTDSLHPSVEQFSNTHSNPWNDEQCAQSSSIPVQTFKAPLEHSERSFKQKSVWDSKKQFSQTYLSTITTDVFLPLVEQFQNISSVVLSNEQGTQSLSKFEQSFKTPVELPERSFTQSIDKEPFSAISTFLPSSANVLQPSVEQFKNTYSTSSYSEKSSLSLPKSEQTFEAPTEGSEKTQKQTNFSATEDLLTLLPTQTDVLQSSIEQFGNNYSVPLSSEQDLKIFSKSEKDVETPYLDIKKISKFIFKINDISIEKEKEDTIISALGLPFIKEFAEMVKSCVHKFSSPINIINYVSNKCKFKNEYYFEVEADPDICSKFYSKFFLKDCLIASETSIIKKRAKLLSAEVAINTLVKLATGERSNSSSNTVKKHKHPVYRITDSRKIFEMFSRNIINRTKDEPAIVTFKDIALLEDMEDCLAFNITSNIISESETEYTCKFFLNEILVSYATAKSIQNAKNIAADLGLIKLKKLEEYEIDKGQLQKKQSHKNKSLQSVTFRSNKAENNIKKPFILNKALFYSSMKDGIVFFQRDRYQINDYEISRILVPDAASFCKKKFQLQVKEVPGSNPPYKKAQAFIGEKEVGVGVSFSVDYAKTVACTRAYINLKRKYYTLKCKDENIEGFFVTRDQVYNGERYSKYMLKKGFIKCKIWKQDRGKINLSKEDLNNSVVGRIMHTSSKQPKKGVKPYNLLLLQKCLGEMLKRFKDSEDYCDLLFSDDFFDGERYQILRMAKQMKLHSLLLYYNVGKIVCVRHKSEVRELLRYLVRNGGSNYKFEMLDESLTVI